MLSRYHISITEDALHSFFAPSALREITRANVGQDSWPSFLGSNAQRHVCDCDAVESLAYIAEEHATIVALALVPDGARRQRAALGRLLHTVQDFFAHTNYVTLWRAERERSEPLQNAAHAQLDPTLLTHPKLQVAQWLTWRDSFYYIPGVGKLLRHVWLPAQSHEAMNLDSPRRGENFHWAVAFARQWTRTEYARAVANVAAHAGQKAVARFRGLAQEVHRPISHPLPGDAYL